MINMMHLHDYLLVLKVLFWSLPFDMV